MEFLTETFNQASWRNLARREARIPLRERTANTILGLLGGGRSAVEAPQSSELESSTEAFGEEERYMIPGVLTLGQRSVRMIMTPRSDISWINCDSDAPTVRAQLLDTIDVIKVHGVLRKAKGNLVLVVDEYGSVDGLVTPLDILEAIAGELPDADETPEIVRDGKGYRGPALAGAAGGQLATERR